MGRGAEVSDAGRKQRAREGLAARVQAYDSMKVAQSAISRHLMRMNTAPLSLGPSTTRLEFVGSRKTTQQGPPKSEIVLFKI